MITQIACTWQFYTILDLYYIYKYIFINNILFLQFLKKIIYMKGSDNRRDKLKRISLRCQN